jgi:Xaa-Pro aminopeptidase
MLETLREKLSALGADALLVTKPANVRYLSQFRTPEDARVLVTPEDALLLTDGRYTAQAAEESQLPVDIATGNFLDRVAELAKGKKLAVEADHLTVAQARDLKDKLGSELTLSKGLVGELRVRKSPKEIAALTAAAQLTDEAFEYILGVIRPGLSEVEVALELEQFMRKAGAERVAFAITVASGYRSSMPHGTASPKELKSGELITLDYGAVIDGYHADMTRTIALGSVPEAQQQMYQAVLESQEAALKALGPNQSGTAVDKVARDILSHHGLGEYFSHSLGHGVGLEIHEAPRLSFLKDDTLLPGMAVTIEPGAYIPGEYGVRIEDLCVITESGHERLSHSPKKLITL